MVIGAATWAGEDQDAFPRTKWLYDFNPDGELLWVIADEAVDANGEVNWPLLGEFNTLVFEGLLTRRSAYFEGIGEADPLGAMTRESLPNREIACLNLAESIRPLHLPEKKYLREKDELIEDAGPIFEGRVVAVRGGLYRGMPGSLLKVEVNRILKAPWWGEMPDYVYSFHFNGSFSLGQYEFCNQHSQLPHLPKAGDTVIVFASSPADKAGEFYEPIETVFVTEDGQVLLTPRMSKLPGFPDVKNAYDVDQYVHRVLTANRFDNEPEGSER